MLGLRSDTLANELGAGCRRQNHGERIDSKAKTGCFFGNGKHTVEPSRGRRGRILTVNRCWPVLQELDGVQVELADFRQSLLIP